MSQSHSRDGSTSASAATVGAELLQQAFINLTRHIYQIEDDARRRQHGSIFIAQDENITNRPPDLGYSASFDHRWLCLTNKGDIGH